MRADVITSGRREREDERLKMSVSGYWCALILLTFTQESLGSHYEKLQAGESRPKEYLRHQPNHCSSPLADRKLIDSTDFRAATEARVPARNSPAAAQPEMGRGVAARARASPAHFSAEIHVTGQHLATAEVLPTERHTSEMVFEDARGVPAARSRSTAAVPWTEVEQQAETSVERSQIRHGRSRSHFARQKVEDAARDSSKEAGRALDRITSKARQEDQEGRIEARRADNPADHQAGSAAPRRNYHSRLSERSSSKDHPTNGQVLERAEEDDAPEGPESLLKLYRARKANELDEGSSVLLIRDYSRLAERNSFKDNSPTGRLLERMKNNAAQKEPKSALKTRRSENHGVLRSSPDPLRDSFKDDPLSKLKKAMSLNRTALAGTADHNATEATGAEHAAEDTSEFSRDLDEEILQDVVLDYTSYEEPANASDRGRRRPEAAQVDIVTRFLRIIENQHTLGENCTAGTDLNLGEGVVDQYAQERFRLEANLAVNRANMLTRLWKYAPEVMLSSEYLLHASVLSMVEFDEDIFAAGNCYDKLQYKDHWLYCPFAHRLPNQDGVLVKDLAIEYKYLSNSSEWFYIARKNAERVIASYEQFSRGKTLLLNIGFIIAVIIDMPGMSIDFNSRGAAGELIK